MDEAHKSGLFTRLLAVRPREMSNVEWAREAGLSRQVFTDIKNRGAAKHDTIEKLLDVAGVSWAQFDAAGAAIALPDGQGRHHVRTTVQEFRAPAATDLLSSAASGHDLPRDIPVLGTAEGAAEPVSEDGHPAMVESIELATNEVIEYKARPPSLARRREIYALYISGESMAPRFEQGELVYVDPKRPPSIGDDVIVQLRNTSDDAVDAEAIVRVMVKRLRRKRPDGFEFEQFNPAMIFVLPLRAVAHVHRIMRLDELV